MLGAKQNPVITSSVDSELLGGMTVSIGDKYTDMKEHVFIRKYLWEQTWPTIFDNKTCFDQIFYWKKNTFLTKIFDKKKQSFDQQLLTKNFLLTKIFLKNKNML